MTVLVSGGAECGGVQVVRLLQALGLECVLISDMVTGVEARFPRVHRTALNLLTDQDAVR